MKKFSLTLLMIGCFVSSPALAQGDETTKVRFHEFGMDVGYAWEDLKVENSNTDYRVYPIFLHFGFKINSLLGLEDHKGVFQFSVDPFISPMTDPDETVEVGALLNFKYTYPLTKRFAIFGEVGAGPMYFGANTSEQGSAGFNFLDQGGGGIQFYFNNDKAVNVGYRFRHISHADLRDSSNGGINSSSVYVGFSKFF